MKYANKLGVDFAVVIGENEIESGVVMLKDMETGTQTEVNLKDLEAKFICE